MRIDRLKVQGFGQLEGVELRFASGLNLLFAPNEAGKSTLLAFVRSILFGFSRRGELAGFEPERGRMGGELLVSTRAGPLHVRRMAAKGRSEGELTLRGPEGEPAADGRLAEALAGISRELFFQVFAFGLDELVSFEKLAAAGSVSEALLAAGTKGAKRLPSALEALRKSSEAIYGPKASRPELNRVLQELESTSDELRAIGNRPAQYLQLSQTVIGLEDELRGAEEEISRLCGERDLLAKLSRATGDLSRLEGLRAPLAQATSLAQFPVEGAARLQALLSKLERARTEAEATQALKEQLERGLSDLASCRFVSDEQGELSGAVREFQSRLEQFRSLSKRGSAIEQGKNETETGLKSLGLEISSAQLLEMDLGSSGRESLLALRREGECAREVSVRAEERGRSAAVQAQRLEAAASELEPLMLPSAREGRYGRWVWAALIALVTAPAALYLLPGPKQIWSVLPAAALGALLLLLLQRQAWRRQRQAEQAFRLREAQLAHQLASYRASRARAGDECTRAQAEQRSAEDARQRLESELESFLRSRGLPHQLSADRALEAWAQLTALQQRLRELSEQSEALALDMAQCHSAAEAVVAEAQRLNLAFDRPEEAAAAIASALEQGHQAQQDRRRLEQSLALAAEEANRLERDRSELETSIGQLLEQGGCRTESEFRARDRQAAAFREAVIESNALALRVGTATGLGLEEARAEVERRGGPAAIASSLQSAEQRLEELGAKRRELSDQLGNGRGRMKRWEEDRQLWQLRERQEALRGQAHQLADLYAVNRLALGLLLQAQRTFEREQQPRIIRLASRIFRELTEGRYLRLYLKPAVPRTLFVWTGSGREWPAERLSRGAREQLFLAFRLAVAEEFAESQEPLPLILDDVLVNFDATRARNTVHALARISRRQQVIAFTCHLHLRDLFASAGATIAELPSPEASLWAESA